MTATYSTLQRRLGDSAGDLDLPLCVTCSTQTSYSGPDLDVTSADSAYKCPICADPRQYIPAGGQKYTTLRNMLTKAEWRNEFVELIPGKVWWMKTRPNFAIAERAFLLKDDDGRLYMWDCIAFVDDDTLKRIDELSAGNGITAMILSHPHYYATTATWMALFPAMQFYVAKADFGEWYLRTDVRNAVHSRYDSVSPAVADIAARIQLVTNVETKLPGSNITAYRLGGHFPGSLVLHFDDSLYIADTIQVMPSALYKSDQPARKRQTSFSFMWR